MVTVDTKTEITLTTGDVTLSAVLEDNQTAKDFLSHLPLTIKMGRWFNREYAGLLQRPLCGDGERMGSFRNGDVAYYPAGPSLAIYYDKEDISHQAGLIRIGRITSGLSIFFGLDISVIVRIEPSKN